MPFSEFIVLQQDQRQDPNAIPWFNFIVNEELGSWAVIVYDESEEFYLGNPNDDVCWLTPDWISDNREDQISGFFVNDTEEGCPFIQEQGWTYAEYTFDPVTNFSISLKGPYGNDWMFMTMWDFASKYPDWFNEFIAKSDEEDSTGGRRLS